MFRNILFPFLLIVLTSAGTVYCWYEDLPLSLFGLVGFFTLALGSMYISYFIFYNIFPDKRNKPLPPLQDLPWQFQQQKSDPQVFTKGAIWATVCATVLVTAGIYGWIKLADQYTAYHFKQYGRQTFARIISSGHSKGIGTYREYEYTDDAGKSHTDKFSNDTFQIGDSVAIIYSTARPIINKVISNH